MEISDATRLQRIGELLDELERWRDKAVVRRQQAAERDDRSTVLVREAESRVLHHVCRALDQALGGSGHATLSKEQMARAWLELIEDAGYNVFIISEQDGNELATSEPPDASEAP